MTVLKTIFYNAINAKYDLRLSDYFSKITSNMKEIWKDEITHPSVKELATNEGYIKYRIKVVFICIHLLFSVFPLFYS